MPQAVVIAGLGAAAGIGGAALQTRSVNRSTQMQEKARQEALAYERQKIAEDKANREKAAAAYRKAWTEWAARAGPEGIQRYGVPVGMSYPGAQKPAAPAARPAAPPEPAPQQGPMPAVPPASAPNGYQPLPFRPPPTQPGGSLGDLMGAPQPQPQAPPMAMAPPTGPTGPTLGSMSGWEDWRRYQGEEA